MATVRSLLRSLEALERSPHFRFQVVRAQSSWVTPSHRRSRQYSCAPQQQVQNRRPVINGKSVAFHINDLKTSNQTTAKPVSSASSSTHPQHSHRRLPKKASQVVTPIREYESDLIVVLDMDECLIHSQFLQGPGAKFAHQVRRANGAAMGESSVDTFHISLPDGERVRVHERPHLHDFLREVSSKYETHIFTAAMEVYAKPVLRMLDPHGEIFTHCWYRESCQLDSNVGAYVKNLGFCWDDERLKRTVLVDNNPLSFLANPENGILVSSFYDDHKDTTLPAVMGLLHELDGHDDVRPVLDERFRLRQALDELSRGRPFAGREQQIDQQVHNEEEYQQQVAVAAS
ncbi:phosphoprotein phosphatase [Nitzschia inconspicua]|uniref:Mitochondrial import inner membrane translocase subunit TIM50 n=1 Tax=Nitzschia inconspicua TaxID=303405 RepID=A0A9K3PM87_9STRA|nr:phosphoprotein phosphatase [Nitzschia inconspicua]